MIDGKNTSLKERVYVVSKNENKISEKYSSCITAQNKYLCWNLLPCGSRFYKYQVNGTCYYFS